MTWTLMLLLVIPPANYAAAPAVARYDITLPNVGGGCPEVREKILAHYAKFGIIATAECVEKHDAP